MLSVRGIPIRAHVTLLIVLPWFAIQYSEAIGVSIFWGLFTAVGLFASVAAHELGHSFVAMSKGIRAVEIVLTPIGGIARLNRIPSRPRDEFDIAIAGPLVSLLLGAALWAVQAAMSAFLPYSLRIVLVLLAATNIVLAIFNLIPCFPMDGGRIFRAAMTRRWGRLEATRRAVKLGAWLAAALFLLGLYRFNVLTMIIAWFVYSSAKAEYRAVQMQETARRMNPFEAFFRPPPMPDGEIEVSVGPPPYRK